MVKNPYLKYKQQSIMTASPGDLTLMLYDGCIKHINSAISYIGDNNTEMRNKSIQKAEAIISELMSTLDMNYKISYSLFQIYEYIYRLLISANIMNDAAKLQEAMNKVTEIRDTWEEAIKIDRKVAYGDVEEG